MQFSSSFTTVFFSFLNDLLHYHRDKEGEQSEAHDQDERPLLVRPAIVTLKIKEKKKIMNLPFKRT